MIKDPAAGSPFPGLNFAGELDDLNELPMEITMTEEWQGYINQLLLTVMNKNHSGRLSHLRFLPDPEQGMVIMVPAASGDEYGAMELKYSDTETGAMINLRRAVKRLNVKKQQGRIRVFPVVERNAPDGQVYLAFMVKGSSTRPARNLKRTEEKFTSQKPNIQPPAGDIAAASDEESSENPG